MTIRGICDQLIENLQRAVADEADGGGVDDGSSDDHGHATGSGSGGGGDSGSDAADPITVEQHLTAAAVKAAIEEYSPATAAQKVMAIIEVRNASGYGDMYSCQLPVCRRQPGVSRTELALC